MNNKRLYNIANMSSCIYCAWISKQKTQAALPQGIVPFVFAKEYNVHPEILSTG
jgi:hypothetical protein